MPSLWVYILFNVCSKAAGPLLSIQHLKVMHDGDANMNIIHILVYRYILWMNRMVYPNQSEQKSHINMYIVHISALANCATVWAYKWWQYLFTNKNSFSLFTFYLLYAESRQSNDERWVHSIRINEKVNRKRNKKSI